MDEFIPYWDRKKQITKRMKEIAALKKQKYTHKQIGEMLGIKSESVDHQMWRMNKRINARYIPPETSSKKEDERATTRY